MSIQQTLLDIGFQLYAGTEYVFNIDSYHQIFCDLAELKFGELTFNLLQDDSTCLMAVTSPESELEFLDILDIVRAMIEVTIYDYRG